MLCTFILPSICYFPGRLENLFYLMLLQITTTGILSGLVKGFNIVKEEQSVDIYETRESIVEHLDRIFSRFPFSDSVNIPDGDLAEYNIGYFLFIPRSLSHTHSLSLPPSLPPSLYLKLDFCLPLYFSDDIEIDEPIQLSPTSVQMNVERKGTM